MKGEKISADSSKALSNEWGLILPDNERDQKMRETVVVVSAISGQDVFHIQDQSLTSQE